jgi:hypothetical protein
MNFKVIATVSNVRPSKSENAELSTTPTSGNIKLNAPGAEKMGLAAGDYVSIVKGQDENGIALYAVKGNAGSEKGETPVVRQVGSILSGKGSLLFSSENAFRELEGNKDEKKVYEIGEAVTSEFEGTERQFFKLNFVRSEAKAARTSKEVEA